MRTFLFSKGPLWPALPVVFACCFPSQTPAQSMSGLALWFDNSTVQYMVLERPFYLSGSNALSIEMWVEPRSIEGGPQDMIWQSGSTPESVADVPDFYVGFRDDGTTLAFGLTTESGYHELHVPIQTADYSNVSWYHLAAVYDGVTQQLYRDGVLIGSTNSTGRLSFASLECALGARIQDRPLAAFPPYDQPVVRQPSTNQFLGGLDEVRVWSVARSMAEINLSMHRTLTGSEFGLHGYWRFDGDKPGSYYALDSSNDANPGEAVRWLSPSWAGLTAARIQSEVVFGQLSVQTEAATDLTTDSAILHGTVALSGQGATAWFEWGFPSLLSNRTPAQILGDVVGTYPVAAALTKLAAGTNFSFRCVASNAWGTVAGDVLPFVTAGRLAAGTKGATDVTTDAAVLHGSVALTGLGATAWFQWGIGGSLTNRTPPQGLGDVVGTNDLSQALANLAPGTTFSFQCVASNATGTVSGSILSFTTGGRLTVTTKAATGLTTNSAVLNGTVGLTGLGATAWFQWGIAGSRTNRTPPQEYGNVVATNVMTEALTDLAPGTTFSFQSAASNAAGTVFGSILSFTTGGRPTATTKAATGVTTNSAVLNGTVRLTGLGATAWFEWGISNALGNRTPLQSFGDAIATNAVTEVLTNLAPGTTFSFRCVASNVVGVVFSNIVQFTTLGRLTVTTLTPATDVTTNSALVAGTVYLTGLGATAWFEWGLGIALDNRTPRQSFADGIVTNAVTQALTNLAPGATFSFRCVASNIAGAVFGNVAQFTTLGQVAVTTLTPATDLTTNSATLHGMVAQSGLGTTAWFEWGIGDALDNRTPSQGFADCTCTNAVAQGLRNLLPGTIYSFRCAASNAAGAAFGSVAQFTTLGRLTVSTLTPASALTTNSATLHGTVAQSGLGATAWFEWGVGSALDDRTPGQSFADCVCTNPVNQLVTNLESGTLHSFRCVASNSTGVFFGATAQFTDLGPTVTTLAPVDLAPGSATLRGAVNPNGVATTVWFEWGTNTTYGSFTVTQGLSAGVGSVTVTQALTNLVAERAYHYRVVVTNTAGRWVGSDQTFTTPLFGIGYSGLLSSPNGSLAWGDYNRDGMLDLVVTGAQFTNSYSAVYRNTGGTFVANSYYWWNTLPNGQLGSVAWGDFNNDGALDLLVTGYGSYSSGPACQILRNDAGVFTNAVSGLPGVGRSAAAWGDFDNDGRPDFIVTGSTATYASQSGPTTNVLFHNNGDGTFTDVHAGLPAVVDGAVAWGDFDNDGQLDLLLAGDTGAGCIARVFRNDHGVFTDVHAGLLGVASGSVAWGDFDGDGWLDIALAGSINNSATGAVCVIYRNNHDGTFTDIRANLPGVYKGVAAWGDYDNDGQLDLLLTGVTNSAGVAATRLYHNDHGVFSEVPAGLPAFTAAAWGDYDGDGWLDVAGLPIASYWSYVSIYRNGAAAGGVSPNVPDAPSSLSASVLNNSVTLLWNAGSDAHTPATGLTYNMRVGTTPGGGEIVPPQSDTVTGQRRLPEMGNAEHGLFATLTNLALATYYWSVQTVNNSFAGSPWAPEQTFAITSGPPVVTTLPASNILCCSAVLNGTVIPGGLATRAWFEWGTTTGFGNATPALDLETGLLPQSVTQPISNLQPLTRYFFRFAATNSAGLVFGTNQSFTTQVPTPTVSEFSASNVTYTTALLLGSPALTTSGADYFVEWGPTIDYGTMAPAGVFDSALEFDGTNDFVAVGWGKFPTITNNFTMELWANPTAARAETAESVSGYPGLGGQRYAIFPDQGTIAYGSSVHAGAGVSIGTNGVSAMEDSDYYLPAVLVHTGSLSGWTHLALVYSNHVPRLYLNGVFVRTGLVSSKLVHPSADLGGMTNTTWGQFAGAIEDVRLWDVPLEGATIQAWVNATVMANHPAYVHLQGYWPLNEGHGTTTTDLSPRGNSGLLMNGATWTGGRKSSARVFGAALTGLSDGTTYHFRAVGVNPGGTTYGADQTFTTLLLPRVLGVTSQAGLSYLLRFSGVPGLGYDLETSTNLFDWAALTNLVAGPQGLFEFLDTDTTNSQTRFYRLKVP